MCTKVYALMLMLFAVVSVYGQDNVIDEVVWVVGDEAILKSDVENERLNAQYEGRKFDGDPYCIIPEQLAIQKLFLHQAAIDSIEVSEQEIISDVERRTNWLIDQIGSKEKVEEYYNKTSTQIREMLRENIRDGKTVQKMQQQIVGDIKITPAEVRRYFKDLPQDSIPFIPTQVEVQIITMEPKIPQEEIERVKKTLRDYTERVTSGEIAFSTLARLYSEDEGSRRRGGIRNEKFTFDDAATYISHDKDTRNNHGLMANPQTGTARFEMQQLAQVSQEAAKMVEGMNVGEISKPFTMINAKGKEICAIVKLKTRLNGHKATITEDYQRLKGIVMEKRSEEKLDKWIRDKQKHTYVRINEKWQKCDFKYPGWVKK